MLQMFTPYKGINLIQANWRSGGYGAIIHNCGGPLRGKRARFRGKYCYLGAPIGTPGVPDGQYMALALGEVGCEKKLLQMTILREYY